MANGGEDRTSGAFVVPVTIGLNSEVTSLSAESVQKFRSTGDSSNRIVCILGMHRSGTSCLAGSLEQAGLVLGEVNSSAMHNKKGNRENQRIMDLHDAILQYSGGAWFDPPEQVHWHDAHRAERDSIIRSFGDSPIWGFKDPRTLLLVDFWREVIPDMINVATFRHPGLVAASLFQRNGRSVDYWYDLWLDYNSRILRLYDVNPFPIISFDLQEIDYRRSLLSVIEILGLRAPPLAEFFDAGLRHHNALGLPPLPEKIDQVYRSLCHVAIKTDVKP